jgi:glycosyltransferase 2 family protein
MRRIWPRILLSVVLFSAVLWRLDLVRIVRVFETIEPGWLLLTLVVLITGIHWSAWKWQFLAQAVGLRPHYGSLVKWYFIGGFFNYVLPTSVGGDMVRITLLGRATDQLPAALASVFMERLTGLIALLGIASVAATLWPVPPSLHFLAPLYGALLSVLLVGVFLLLRREEPLTWDDHPENWLEKIKNHLSHFFLRMARYRHHSSTVAIALLMSLVFQLQVIATAWLVASSLGLEVSWQACFLCVPLATLATLLPVSFNGIGIRESAYILLFTQAGLSSEEAFSLAFATFIFVLLVNLVGGMISMFTEKEVTPKLK